MVALALSLPTNSHEAVDNNLAELTHNKLTPPKHLKYEITHIYDSLIDFELFIPLAFEIL